MKQLCIYLFALVWLCSCRQPRVAATSQPEGFFKRPGTSSFAHAGDTLADIYIEFKELDLPMQVATDQYPDWQSFRNQLSGKQAVLSADAREYAAQLLLNGYQLYRQPYSEAVAQEIPTQLNQLVACKHKGYGLLYNGLVWLNNNNAALTAAALKPRILAYAKPLLGPPNPNLPDSPEIVNNPGLKADMDRIVAKIKENDSYIEKIKGL